jgi:hypothetical protein
MPFGCIIHCAAIGIVSYAEQQGRNQCDDGRQPNLEINIP